MYKHKSATTTLQAHIKKCENNNAQQTQLKFPAKATQIKKKHHEEIAESFVDFCARDRAPFSSVEGNGMAILLNTFIKIGHIYGPIDVTKTKILPSATTISRKLKQRAEKERANMKEQLENVKKDPVRPIAIASDLWEDDVKKYAYLGMSVQYVDEHFKLHNRVLELQEFNSLLKDSEEANNADLDSG